MNCNNWACINEKAAAELAIINSAAGVTMLSLLLYLVTGIAAAGFVSSIKNKLYGKKRF